MPVETRPDSHVSSLRKFISKCPNPFLLFRCLLSKGYCHYFAPGSWDRVRRRSASGMKTRPQSWRDISAAPRLFIAVVVLCGTLVMAYAVWHGHSQNPLKFFCYLVIALAASRLKVN